MFVCRNFCPYWADFTPYRNRSFVRACLFVIDTIIPFYTSILKTKLLKSALFSLYE